MVFKQIYYQDESWVNENLSFARGIHIPEKPVIGDGRANHQLDPWLRGVGQRFEESLFGMTISIIIFKKRFTTCFSNYGGFSSKPSGTGKRIILLDIGSEVGFLGVGKQFVGKKNTADYHSEMNSDHFNECITEVV